MKNLIYIVSIDHPTSKNKCSDYSKYCIASWTAWCKKYDIDIIVNTEHDSRFGRPIWNKELIYEIGKEYEKIGVVDSDTMVKWNAPNIFETFEDEFCGVNDIADFSWMMNSISQYKKFFPGTEIDLMKYMNAGVLFFHNKYLDVFKQVLDLYLSNQEELDNWNKGGGREQTILNYILVKNNVKKKLLDPGWNLLSIHKKNMFTHNWQLNIDPLPYFVKYANVWHFTGFPVEDRKRIMEQTWTQYKKKYI